MSSESVCRLCLKIDISLRTLSKTPLQEVYEKLTNSPLNTACKPTAACSVCHWQLRKCHKLMSMAMRADKLLTNILQTGALINREIISTIDRKMYKLENDLSISPTEMNIVKKPVVSIKEEMIKEETISYLNEVEMESEHTAVARSIKLETSDDVDVVVARLVDLDGIVNEELIDEAGLEERVGAEDSKDGIDTEEVNCEALCDPIDDDEEVEGADPAIKCDVQQSTQAGIQDTKIQKAARKRDTLEEDKQSDSSAPVEENTVQDIKLISSTTSRYCTVVLNKINIDLTKKHSSYKYICDVCGDVFSRKYLLARHTAQHNPFIDNKQIKDSKKRPRTKRVEIHSSFECETCQKTFDNASGLYKHSQGHSDEKPFKCSICRKKFKRKSQVDRHLKTHTRDKDLKCIICSKKFYKQFNLEYHLLSHFRKRFKCATCQKSFKTKNNLTTHVKRHVEGYFPCTICQRTFKVKHNLDSHVLKAHNTKCPICQKVIKYNSDLKKHLRTHSGEKPFECAICQNSFRERSDLNRHLKVHSGEKPFECDICQRKFTAKFSLIVHQEKHFGVKTPFECAICLKKFNRNFALKAHLRTHSGVKVEKKLECDICQKRFSCNSSLFIHLRTHSGEKPFKCEICLSAFITNGDLRRHLKRHAEERPFECDICQRRFKEKNNIAQHIKSHSWDKPFECTVCHRGFAYKGDLKRHLETHTGEKPFECKICRKTFLRSAYLTRHLIRHTGEKPFKCKKCGKGFCIRGDLNQHLKTHIEEKLYECAICQKRLKMRHNLVLHLQSHAV